MCKIKYFVLILPLILNVYSLERELTVHIDAKAKECYYEFVKSGNIIDVEYQVVDGGHGDLDINFELAEGTGRIIFADFKKSDNIHRYEVKGSGGEYKICFDNSFSNFNRKTVFFELLIEDPDDPNDNNVDNFSDLDGLTPEEFYSMKVEDILDSISRVKHHITRTRQIQDLLRSFEARDRNLAEMNNFRVNIFSLVIILTMVSVGMLQVYMVRSLFDTSKGQNIWNKISKLVAR